MSTSTSLAHKPLQPVFAVLHTRFPIAASSFFFFISLSNTANTLSPPAAIPPVPRQTETIDEPLLLLLLARTFLVLVLPLICFLEDYHMPRILFTS
jgi:hypothetical protein